MDQSKYDNCIITDMKSGITLPSFRQREAHGQALRKERVLWVDGDVFPGSFYSEYVWFFPGQAPTPEQMSIMGPEPHVHPFDEVIGLVGSNQSDIFDLGGEVELWLEDQCFTFSRSFLVYVPAGMRHCPLRIKRIDSPIFLYTLGSNEYYGGERKETASKTAGEDLSAQFVFEYKKGLVHPEYRGKGRDVPGVHEHIAYLDREVVPGANFYVEASWFGTAERPPREPGKEPAGPQPHVHPFPEIITFFGTNPDDVHDLGGEVELWIDGEQHIITRSFVAYIPGDVVHCPLLVRKIGRPMFHFTAGPGSMYV